MQIWFHPFAFTGKTQSSLCEDRPTLQRIAGDKIKLEGTGRNGAYAVELTRDECERIAEAIDWQPVQYAGRPPP
jgi:hypothetical protein